MLDQRAIECKCIFCQSDVGDKNWTKLLHHEISKDCYMVEMPGLKAKWRRLRTEKKISKYLGELAEFTVRRKHF